MHQACVFAAQVRWQSKIRKHMAAVQHVGALPAASTNFSNGSVQNLLSTLQDRRAQSVQLPTEPPAKVRKVDDMKPLLAQYGLGYDLEYEPIMKQEESFQKESEVWDSLIKGGECQSLCAHSRCGEPTP